MQPNEQKNVEYNTPEDETNGTDVEKKKTNKKYITTKAERTSSSGIEFVPETETTSSIGKEEVVRKPIKVEEPYDLLKPKRIKIRGNIIHDKD